MDLAQFGIYKVKLPLPFKLDHVNCYAVKGRQGWVIVDSGLNYEPTRRAWLDFMDSQGFKPRDITGIYVTHYHPDHYGAAGWLQQISGAPVYMSSIEASLVERIWRRNDQDKKIIAGMFRENGMPGDLINRMLAGLDEMRSMVDPQPRVTPISNGGEVLLGDYRYRVVLTPGHSDGHVCFYQEQSGLLLSGDHLLPKISSNISLWPYAHPDPLHNFLTSLEESHRLNASLVLPAHGDCFSNLRERVGELQAHHRERLNLMKRIASRGASAYQVCREVFGDRLSFHELRFAMTETLAHLVYLEKRGELLVSKVDGVYIYSS
ncbi:MBL fold metallo-hydrolase [Desulfofundulus sp.]|uniref:MBL fold metallo-hydrolase n=1 Tax=Desulfofundulus sp. TaxID=2282750 RepID=UPI003C720CD1